MLIVFGILAGALLLYALLAFFLKPDNSRKGRMLAFAGQYIAHRGLFDNRGDAPENTMLAFERAVGEGYGIETDVHLTNDNVLVLHHDHFLKRSCGREGRLESLNYREIRDLKVFGSRQGIPTFQDFLEMVNGQVPLIIELKAEPGDDVELLCSEACFFLDSYEGLFCIESFNPKCVWWFKKHRPQMLRGQLAERGARPGFIGFLLSACFFNFLTRPDFIAYNWHHSNLLRFRLLRKVFKATAAAWTIRSEEELRQMQELFDVFIFDGFEPGEVKDESKRRLRAAAGGKSMEGIVRRHVYFSGRVQGVGFRYFATNYAHDLGVTGWVKNLSDDRVEMEMQGTPEMLERLIQLMRERRFVEIDEIEIENIPVDPESYEFKVRY